jgi:hypothetical protein
MNWRRTLFCMLLNYCLFRRTRGLLLFSIISPSKETLIPHPPSPPDAQNIQNQISQFFLWTFPAKTSRARGRRRLFVASLNFIRSFLKGPAFPPCHPSVPPVPHFNFISFVHRFTRASAAPPGPSVPQPSPAFWAFLLLLPPLNLLLPLKGALLLPIPRDSTL